MPDALIYLDQDSSLSLQAQIRQKMVEAIQLGVFPPDRRLPSSRKLAEQLGVARNTVVLAYEQLVAEGYLVSRERSGVYVNERIFEGRVGFQGRPVQSDDEIEWHQRLRQRAPQRSFHWPDDWQSHPYPFIDGYFDTSLYPITEWRESTRLALGVREMNQWATATDYTDDAQLVEEIRTKVLPRRGIQARAEEILITVGTQNALYLLVNLLVDGESQVAMEEPGAVTFGQMVQQRGATLRSQAVDAEGMVIDDALDEIDVTYVTPLHQVPTGVTLSMARRRELLERAATHDFLIIEDDSECEGHYLGTPHPALRGMDRENRVIYVSYLSKVLAPGLRLGFMVGAPALVREARRLRRLVVGHPPMNNQRAAAFFLSLGHFDAFTMRLNRIFRERWSALRDALNHYLPQSVTIMPSQGGTAQWIRGPDNLDVDALAQEAARHGILLEPVHRFYRESSPPGNCFRLGVTSLGESAIRDGVAALASLIREMTTPEHDFLPEGSVLQLTGDALRAAMADATIVTRTVYGDPCTITLRADGTMEGAAGYENEDCDQGQWRVEGTQWIRRWNQWSYGEEAAFFVAIEGQRIRWYNTSRRRVDAAIIRPANPGSDRK